MLTTVGYTKGTGESSLTELLAMTMSGSTVLGSTVEHSSVAFMSAVSLNAEEPTTSEPHSLMKVASALLLGETVMTLDVVLTSTGMSLAVALVALVELVSFPAHTHRIHAVRTRRRMVSAPMTMSSMVMFVRVNLHSPSQSLSFIHTHTHTHTHTRIHTQQPYKS